MKIKTTAAERLAKKGFNLEEIVFENVDTAMRNHTNSGDTTKLKLEIYDQDGFTGYVLYIESIHHSPETSLGMIKYIG